MAAARPSLEHRALHVVAALGGGEEAVADQVAGAHLERERLVGADAAATSVISSDGSWPRPRPHRTAVRDAAGAFWKPSCGARLLFEQSRARMSVRA